MGDEKLGKLHFIRLLQDLHTTKRFVDDVLASITTVLDSWSWLEECRGSYSWDDDSFFDEVGNCFDAIRNVIDDASRRCNEHHEVCCGEYGHLLGEIEKRPVQMQFEFGESYEDYVERMVRLSTNHK